MFARFFYIRDTIKSYDDKLEGIHIFCVYEIRLSKDYRSFSIIRSAEFKQISQVQGKFLTMLSLSVKWVKELQTLISKILNLFKLMF